MSDDLKFCKKCNKWKNKSEFWKDKRAPDKLRYNCKQCINLEGRISAPKYTERKAKYNKEYKINNREKTNTYSREYYRRNKDRLAKIYRERRRTNPQPARDATKKWCAENKERVAQYDKEYRKKNADRINKRNREFYQIHQEEKLAIINEWREKNKDKYKQYKEKWYKANRDKIKRYGEKYSSTVMGSIHKKMSCSIRASLKNGKNGRKWETLVGYTTSGLKEHIESLFIDDMSWNKFINGEIHLDHMIPKSLWKFETPNDREFRQCWALCNLQPLWAFDNLSKHNKCL